MQDGLRKSADSKHTAQGCNDTPRTLPALPDIREILVIETIIARRIAHREDLAVDSPTTCLTDVHSSSSRLCLNAGGIPRDYL